MIFLTLAKLPCKRPKQIPNGTGQPITEQKKVMDTLVSMIEIDLLNIRPKQTKEGQLNKESEVDLFNAGLVETGACQLDIKRRKLVDVPATLNKSMTDTNIVAYTKM